MKTILPILPVSPYSHSAHLSQPYCTNKAALSIVYYVVWQCVLLYMIELLIHNAHLIRMFFVNGYFRLVTVGLTSKKAV